MIFSFTSILAVSGGCVVKHTQDQQGPPAEERDRGLRRRHGTNIAGALERQPAGARDVQDLSQEWRRLFAELFGTFLLVLVGAGGAILEARTGTIGRAASVAQFRPWRSRSTSSGKSDRPVTHGAPR